MKMEKGKERKQGGERKTTKKVGPVRLEADVPLKLESMKKKETRATSKRSD